MAIADRGFASMDRVKRREIASKGGKAAHQKGTAHEWTSEQAREAGHRGGMASHRQRAASSVVVPCDVTYQALDGLEGRHSDGEEVDDRESKGGGK